MKQLPRPALIICSALLLAGVILAGMMSGSAIGADAMLERSAGTLIGDRQPATTPAANQVEPSQHARKQLPDHYPLVTPTGTIPVAALAAHGRFRGEHGGWQDSAEDAALSAQYPGQLDETEIDRLAQWTPARQRVSKETAIRVHTSRTVRIEAGESAPAAMPGQQVAAAATKTAQAAQQVAPPTEHSAK